MNIRINEQIAFLRKHKGITQEELACELGVTNQSVSKWESGICCPDIQLLPSIARYFGVSIDELLGYKPADTFENVYLKIKQLFIEAPMEDSFMIAFRLAILLHEGACTRGYKGYVPWDTIKNHGLNKEYSKWDYSACSEPEGAAVYCGNKIFISDGNCSEKQSTSDIRKIYTTLESLCSLDTLKVLYGLYELTRKDYSVFVSLEEVINQCGLSKERVQESLDKIPVETREDSGRDIYYRIQGCFMHIPPMLELFKNV